MRRRFRVCEGAPRQAVSQWHANGHRLVTRNVKDFEHCGVELINPWIRDGL